MFKDKTILITGGSGSLGQELTKQLLEFNPFKIIVYSRRDHDHAEMERKFNYNPKLRFFIGDVRDYERLNLALHDVDYVIHTASLKHIDRAEYNPIEYKKTIVDGAENVIRACLEQNVKKCVALSTDKASNPSGVYGSAKLISDKLFMASNLYSRTKFSVIRYGNVIDSNGSMTQKISNSADDIINITDRRMTRFWITKKYAAELVLHLLDNMSGNEMLIPKLPTCNVLDFLKAMKPKAKIVDIPIRPSEKIHESMLLSEDSRNTLDFDSYYISYPKLPENKTFAGKVGTELKDGFEYKSSNKNWVLTNTDVYDILNGRFKFD